MCGPHLAADDFQGFLGVGYATGTYFQTHLIERDDTTEGSTYASDSAYVQKPHQHISLGRSGRY